MEVYAIELIQKEATPETGAASKSWIMLIDRGISNPYSP